jgi:hypothetical protein
MKKNYTIVFAAIAALIVLCAFWSCDSGSDDDGGPSSALGDKEITLAEGVQVYNDDGSEYQPGSVQTVRAQSSQTGASYAALSLGSIDADGKLTLNLPVFTQWSEIGGGAVTGLTVEPPDVKVAEVSSFLVAGNDLRLQNNDGGKNQIINYEYADRDAHIYGQGTVTNPAGLVEINLFLKKGWNSVIIDFPPDYPSSNSTMVTGSPGAGFKWVWDD